ncbi:uncharacterized protein LOC130766171 [Actinidia eriantha]|uniref:uncharacterized protein LOC130766171 n=1 Tax=Actinidia eriantha TaxID=165200 RepID=UPI0025894176|nr:uncharacterized protein LOC130766171 [Actinidia eriantha]
MAMLNGTTTNPFPKPQIGAVLSVVTLKYSGFRVVVGRVDEGIARESVGGGTGARWEAKARRGRGRSETRDRVERQWRQTARGTNLKTWAEFLDSEDREREAAEAALVFWNDIELVTSFQCGGYLIGISCSLFVADPMAITSFFRRWAKIQNKIVFEAEMTKLPIFYLPNLKPNGSPLTNQSSLNQSAKTLIVKIDTNELNLNDESCLALMLFCIEEVGIKLGVKMTSKFSLLMEEPSKGAKVESYLREGLMEKPLEFKNGLNCARWDDFWNRFYSVAFRIACASEGSRTCF